MLAIAAIALLPAVICTALVAMLLALAVYLRIVREAIASARQHQTR